MKSFQENYQMSSDDKKRKKAHTEDDVGKICNTGRMSKEQYEW